MIHPDYIRCMIDMYHCRFNMYRINDNYIFYIEFIHPEIKLLYKIKHRFKNGKIIQLKNDNYVLKISKQLDPIIQFILKNRPYCLRQHVNFLRWRYLYINLYLEKESEKSEKTWNKINLRLKYFNCSSNT